jgi:bifunctional DNA-binding transcriptional regulator/antitoxin component of YhaV-PrlF toxin-antitoxin module
MQDIKGNPIGIVRRIDKLGRIVIPMEFRREYSINDDAKLEIMLYENGIFIKPWVQENAKLEVPVAE